MFKNGWFRRKKQRGDWFTISMPIVYSYFTRTFSAELWSSTMQNVHRIHWGVNQNKLLILIQKYFFKGDDKMCRMFRRNTKKRSQHLRIFFYLKHYCSFLKIMPDRGFRNDMKKLSIVCSICDWNGLFKDYEVK